MSKPLDCITTSLKLIVMICASLWPTVARGQDVDSYLGGLAALEAKDFTRAAEQFAKAAAADPQSAIMQLDHGVALLMAGQGDEARDALARAQALDPKSSEIKIWSMVRAILFDPTIPQAAMPSPDVPYSPTLYVAAMGCKSPNADDRARARVAMEGVVAEFAQRQRYGMEGIRVLYAAGRYRDALETIDVMRSKGPVDGIVLAYAGHCRLGLREYEGARETYTESLRLLPTQPGSLIGRARCEIMMGSLDAAEADLQLASRIGMQAMATSLAEAEQRLAKAKLKPQQSPGLTNRNEQFTRELCRLELDQAAHPNEVRYLLALAQFHLQPTAVCDLTLLGVPTKGRVPCGNKDIARMAAVMDQAMKLAPNDPAVLIQQARLDLARGRLDDMMNGANQALAAGTSDLEVAVAYLQYGASEANRMNAEAKRLRAPGKFIEVRDVNGNWTKEYIGPTADDYSRADELDRKAKEYRDNATYALQVLQKQTAGATDVQQKMVHQMVNAYHDLWFKNLEGATLAAEQARAIDPVNEHVLRFLVEVYGMTGSPKLQECRRALGEVKGGF